MEEYKNRCRKFQKHDFEISIEPKGYPVGQVFDWVRAYRPRPFSWQVALKLIYMESKYRSFGFSILMNSPSDLLCNNFIENGWIMVQKLGQISIFCMKPTSLVGFIHYLISAKMPCNIINVQITSKFRLNDLT